MAVKKSLDGQHGCVCRFGFLSSIFRLNTKKNKVVVQLLARLRQERIANAKPRKVVKEEKEAKESNEKNEKEERTV